MAGVLRRLTVLFAVAASAMAGGRAGAATEELGGGFRHHGVATPVSNHRGTVATVDGRGRNVVLVWLFDPKSRRFKDYGHVHKESWPQYQRYVAADEAGRIYFAGGSHLYSYKVPAGARPGSE